MAKFLNGRENKNGRMKILLTEQTTTAGEFKCIFRKAYQDFREHVERVQIQFQTFNELKEKVPATDMIVQMDFAENFVCRSDNEVQSAYWAQESVTLHPVVAYYRKDDEHDLDRKSFMIV